MKEISVKEVKRVTDKKQPPAWLLEASKKIDKASIDVDAPIIDIKRDEENEIDKRK